MNYTVINDAILLKFRRYVGFPSPAIIYQLVIPEDWNFHQVSEQTKVQLLT